MSKVTRLESSAYYDTLELTVPEEVEVARAFAFERRRRLERLGVSSKAAAEISNPDVTIEERAWQNAKPAHQGTPDGPAWAEMHRTQATPAKSPAKVTLSPKSALMRKTKSALIQQGKSAGLDVSVWDGLLKETIVNELIAHLYNEER